MVYCKMCGKKTRTSDYCFNCAESLVTSAHIDPVDFMQKMGIMAR